MNKQNKFLLYGLILVVVLAVAGYAYLSYVKSKPLTFEEKIGLLDKLQNKTSTTTPEEKIQFVDQFSNKHKPKTEVNNQEKLDILNNLMNSSKRDVNN